MNPDQVLLRQFSPAIAPLAIDSSPLAVLLGARLLSVDVKAGRVTVAFAPGEQVLQGHGVIQGGVVAGILDLAAAFAVLAMLPDGESAATASMTVSYFAAARAGQLVATGMVERAGRRLMFARAELRAEEGGPVLASANAVMSVRPDRPPGAA